jgi:hypothetical protein
VEAVFDAFSQWAAQGEWMLGTRVEVAAGDGRSANSQVAAWTGVGPVGFWNTMTITRWEPPYRVDVVHTGSLVRGPGAVEVLALPDGRSRVVWSEHLDLPFGLLGQIGWSLLKPAFMAGVKRSLRSFARLVETGTLPR